MTSVDVTGKTVCLHEDRWVQLQSDLAEDREMLRDMHRRMFKDNGTTSIQTSLVQGANRMQRIEEQYGNLRIQLAAITEQLTKYQNGTAAVAVNEIELEQKVGTMFGKLVKTVGHTAHGTTKAAAIVWVSCAVMVTMPCLAYIVHLLKG